MFDKSNLLNYSFYDESGELVVVLNNEYIKELFGANKILLDEKEHR